MSPSRPLLSSDRNVHRLSAETGAAQVRQAGAGAGGDLEC